MRFPRVFRPFIVLALWVVMIAAIAFSWKITRVYFFEFPQQPASLRHLRLPVRGESMAYQSMMALRHPQSDTVEWELRVQGPSKLAFGLAPLSDQFDYAGEYRFRVYEVKKRGRDRQLVNVVEEFPAKDFARFEIDAHDAKTGGVKRFRYTLSPTSIKGKLATAIESAKGQYYYKSFAFLKPTVMSIRKPEEKNIIFISFDTLRADRLGSAGRGRATTPNIDTFAKKAVLFKNAIAPASCTAPSHFSVFSGLYPTAWEGPVAGKMLAEILQESDYYTIAFTAGAGLAGTFGFSKGFDRYVEFTPLPIEHPEDETQKIFDNAIAWLEHNHDYKFFMFVHNYECHDPYEDDYFLSSQENPSLIEARRALYDGDVRRADEFFGRLIETLRSLELLDDTIIVFFSDHGEDFYDHYTEADIKPQPPEPPIPEISLVDHGHSLYEEIIKVPLIIYFPDFEKSATIENQVRLIDLFPTVLDYLDISCNCPLQGESLMPLIKTGERDGDPPAMSEFTWTGPEQKSIRWNGYKYIFVEHPEQKKQGISYGRVPRHALFDLTNDPNESMNIYEKNKALGEQYHTILTQKLEESRAINRALQAERDASEAPPDHMPDDVVQSLKSLGYLK